jgi:hypothetical protein
LLSLILTQISMKKEKIVNKLHSKISELSSKMANGNPQEYLKWYARATGVFLACVGANPIGLRLLKSKVNEGTI